MENAALLRPWGLVVLCGYFSLRAVLISGFIGLTTALAIRELPPVQPERSRRAYRVVDETGRPVSPWIEEPAEKRPDTNQIRVAAGKVVSVIGEFEDVIWLWAFGSAMVFIYSFLGAGLWRGLGWCRVILVTGAPIVDFFTLIVLLAVDVEYGESYHVSGAGSAVLALTVYAIAIAVLWTQRASEWFMSMRALRKDRASISNAGRVRLVMGLLLLAVWGGLSTLSLFNAIYRADWLGSAVLAAASAIAVLGGLLLAIPPAVSHPARAGPDNLTSRG